MRILVTGGTGHLGRPVVAGLIADGHRVRVLARTPGHGGTIDWAPGDLGTGEGVRAAVAGMDVIVHAATNSPAARRGGIRPLDLVRSPTDVDVEGTRALLDAARSEGVGHFLHVSIVGLEHTRRLPYSRVKLEAEELVRRSGVPWTIVRATPFYWLFERMLARMTEHRVVLLPGRVRTQPVDEDDFAAYVVRCVEEGPSGERMDFVGPETLTVHALAEQYMAARGLERRLWNAPLPRRAAEAFEASNTSSDAVHGTTTWAEWLAA